MKRLFLISLFAIFSFPALFACGPYDREYLASQYFMFRLFGDNMDGSLNKISQAWERQENCKKWAEATSPALPLKEIEEVVYEWDLEQVENLFSKKESPRNAFAKWIVEHKDKETADFLILAKQCEKIRTAQNTRWYYFVDGDEESEQLKRLAKQAQAYKGKRLKDRYLLQTIRALFAARQYASCVALWKNSSRYFRNDIIKDFAANYIAGAYQHLGQNDKASKMNLKRDNAETKALCEFQSKIHYYEWNDWEENVSDYRKLYRDVCSTISQNKIKDKARWFYTKAFLADKVGKQNEALSGIRAAKSFSADTDLKSSIRVLEFFLNTKYQKSYGSDFEDYLYGELLWLDKKISDGLTPKIKKDIQEHGVDNHICGWSIYYWNDMLRKIVIGNVAPLCIKSKYKTRALQFLNMADNLIFVKCQNVMQKNDAEFHKMYLTGKIDMSKAYKKVTWNDYHNSINNKYDYYNDYYINLDSLGVNYVKKLAYRMSNPQKPLDNFLNSRSYTDPQFLNDIIGTQLIAAGKYTEAAEYLGKVSAQFYRGKSVSTYFGRNPFEIGSKTAGKNGKKPKIDLLYRLHFAQNMSRLEKEISETSNPNTKAEKMLSYARGMQNSISECWALTSFHWGYWYCYPFHNQYKRHNVNTLAQKAQRIKAKAFAKFTDKERAAKAYKNWCMWKTAVTKCPNTQTAKEIRRHCDNLVDYKPKLNISPGFFE